jgi:hypothetical protein
MTMTTKLTRDAFEKLIAEDLAWLLQQPRTLERDHVADLLRDASRLYYPATIPDHMPPDPVTRTALAALAMFFDERHAARVKLAEEMRADEDPDYPEHRTMADAWLHAANTTWELAGGRPDGLFAQCDHQIKIGARELGKLIEMGTRSSQSQQVPNTAPADVQFDEGLVERLARAYGGEAFASLAGIRRILSVLATMPMELPTDDALDRAVEFANAQPVVDDGYEGKIDRSVLAGVEGPSVDHDTYVSYAAAIGHIHGQRAEFVRLSPILAAKDAELGRLANERGEAIARAGRYAATIARQRDRISELERRVAAGPSEALGRVMRRIANATPDGRFDVSSGEFPALLVDNVVAIIDDEIASVGSAVPHPSPIATSNPTIPSRIFLGVSFERELPNGEREKVDPSKVRLVVEGDDTLLVPVGFGGSS